MASIESTNRERRLVLDTSIMNMEAADPFHLRDILWSDGEDFFYLQLPTQRPRNEDDEARSASAVTRNSYHVPYTKPSRPPNC